MGNDEAKLTEERKTTRTSATQDEPGTCDSEAEFQGHLSGHDSHDPVRSQ